MLVRLLILVAVTAGLTGCTLGSKRATAASAEEQRRNQRIEDSITRNDDNFLPSRR